MKIDIYKELAYEEDERKRIPYAYADNGKGNRRCQHINIVEKNAVEDFLKTFNLYNILDDEISIAILWNLPRAEYNEKNMWVCLSGFTYNNEDFYPKHFVISDNLSPEKTKDRAMDVLEYLNKVSGIEVNY